ncbi:MAG TPA: DUF3164 family protein [Lentimicrobium sp.]|nr:DUF3164 family protein [Bacteroidales bacterium]HLO92452.1 DUF3164 family protein [Lentimicrobium sp.]
MNQKSTAEFWIDEAGNKIPYNRTNKVERLMERQATKLLAKAKEVQAKLIALKAEFQAISDEVYNAFMAEREIKSERKGNFTWYNFDRSIKVEINISERITFDELTITGAREKLDQFLTENMDGKIEFIKELVIDAFKTSKGQLDAKKIMSLLKYRSKIKHEMYQSAMNDIESAIRRPSSRTYYRIFERTESGDYKLIDLNLSSI